MIRSALATKVLIGIVVVATAAAAIAGAAYVAVRDSSDAKAPPSCAVSMTVRMVPVLLKDAGAGGRTPRVPDEASTFAVCSDSGKVMLDERDRGAKQTDRWMGVSGDLLQIDDRPVPFGFRDRSTKTVAFTFFPGHVALVASDGSKLLATFDGPADSVRAERKGGGARVRLSATARTPSGLYTRGTGDDQTDEAVELTIELTSTSVGYGFADIPGVTSTCVTLTGKGEGYVAGSVGSAACVAQQPNGAGAAFTTQAFFAAKGTTAVEASVDVGVYVSVSDAGWISDTLGWDTCGEASAGLSGHLVVGGSVEMGVCGTAEGLETWFFSVSVGGGAGAGFGASAGISTSHTAQHLCFHPDPAALLRGKAGKCAPDEKGPPKKPTTRPRAGSAPPTTTTTEDSRAEDASITRDQLIAAAPQAGDLDPAAVLVDSRIDGEPEQEGYPEFVSGDAACIGDDDAGIGGPVPVTYTALRIGDGAAVIVKRFLVEGDVAGFAELVAETEACRTVTYRWWNGPGDRGGLMTEDKRSVPAPTVGDESIFVAGDVLNTSTNRTFQTTTVASRTANALTTIQIVDTTLMMSQEDVEAIARAVQQRLDDEVGR